MKNLHPSSPAFIRVRSVVIYDESPVVRRWLTGVMTGTAESFRTVSAVGTVPELLAAYVERRADLVLVGVHRASTGGADAAQMLLDADPRAPVVVFGSLADACFLSAAVACGARGLMLLDPDDEGRPFAPRVSATPTRTPALAGPKWTPASAGSKRPPATGRTDDPAMRTLPSERQLAILRGMSRGSSNKEIGGDLLVSEDTVKTQAGALFRTLGARDRAHAVALGLRQGLLT